jgi:hypothetical protein
MQIRIHADPDPQPDLAHYFLNSFSLFVANISQMFDGLEFERI